MRRLYLPILLLSFSLACSGCWTESENDPPVHTEQWQPGTAATTIRPAASVTGQETTVKPDRQVIDDILKTLDDLDWLVDSLDDLDASDPIIPGD